MHRHFIQEGMLANGLGSDGLTPFEVVKFAAWDEGTMAKCNFCAHRIDQGLEPACVVTCPTECRIFGDLEEESGRLQHLIRERGGTPLLPECQTRPSVYYLEE